MSTRQSAIINGLIAENIGKNDLVRSADSRASEAELRAKKSEYAASDLLRMHLLSHYFPSMQQIFLLFAKRTAKPSPNRLPNKKHL